MKYRLITLCVMLLALTDCSDDRKDIDISEVNLNVEVERFEQYLFSFPPDSVCDYIPEFQKKYGEFFELFSYYIINIGTPNSTTYCVYLKSFVNDYMILNAKKKCDQEFSNIDDLNAELTDAFRHYRYYFPEKPIPRFYSCISGFNQSIVTSDDFICISMDKYLGRNCKFYNRLGLPLYMRNQMHKGKIVPDCAIAWSQKEFPFQESDSTDADSLPGKNTVNNLLNNMIYHGKIMYLASCLLPEQSDSLLFGYTPAQLKYCEEYEKQMWSFLIERKLLFTQDYMDIKKFIDDGPFTTPFTQKSPSRTGIWLGYRIVSSYMKNHPEISVPQLMNNRNYLGILQLSKYNP